MNTKHVPDLELCQELDRLCKEKGIVVPETEFIWVKEFPIFLSQDSIVTPDEYKMKLEASPLSEEAKSLIKTFPAPLVSQLGELLPWTLAGVDIGGDVNVSIEFQKVGYIHGVMYVENNETVASFKDDHIEQWDDKEANARQKMINYLITEGIITKL